MTELLAIECVVLAFIGGVWLLQPAFPDPPRREGDGDGDFLVPDDYGAAILRNLGIPPIPPDWIVK